MSISKIISLVAMISFLIAGGPAAEGVDPFLVARDVTVKITSSPTTASRAKEYGMLFTGLVPYGIVFPHNKEFVWPVEITFAFACRTVMSVLSWLPTIGGIICAVITAFKMSMTWEQMVELNMQDFPPSFIALSIILGASALLPSLTAIIGIFGFLINGGLYFLPVDSPTFNFIVRFIPGLEEQINQDATWKCLEKNAKFVGALLLNYLVQMLLQSLLSPVLLFIATTLMVVGTNFILSNFLITSQIDDLGT